ncbi:MAG TPA: DUF4265 domain-containing protein [Candidatus Corynebacterium avicola]|uniref:DUF4265 domain-containing protein n=1 Tax=Candidatus Corynebacterium avicola TaxID=2838527 RepID=A0A9D1UJM7_9CORY|nr:DUF4265 domain-containing protein [Candidatus Corynebacterium avicola]
MNQPKRHLRSTPPSPHPSPSPRTASTVRTVTARVDPAPGRPAGVPSESLVTWDIGGGHYVIRSVPVVATHLTHGDIVACSESDGRLFVDELVLHGGGHTIRMLVDENHPGARPGLRDRLAVQLIRSGCVVEKLGHHILAIGVGPDVDSGDIGTLCDSWEDTGVVKVLG